LPPKASAQEPAGTESQIEDLAKGRELETVITATRIPTQPDEQPRAMNVVTQEDLSRRLARTTPEALTEQ
jgi:outer membrane receptor protein involved in Fe transport